MVCHTIEFIRTHSVHTYYLHPCEGTYNVIEMTSSTYNDYIIYCDEISLSERLRSAL